MKKLDRTRPFGEIFGRSEDGHRFEQDGVKFGPDGFELAPLDTDTPVEPEAETGPPVVEAEPGLPEKGAEEDQDQTQPVPVPGALFGEPEATTGKEKTGRK